ncbi:type ii secretion system protein e : Type II secretion system protein E OS=Pirellula staleyi (strain ATCC 27377 / DSM 6068 / ICPB 4128) GN=Psta_1434 PE=4 SV=1: T2SE [Tuwongella immobilis]|uniref:Bacterial type II secretion system protein E domain-containing protein n=2 Tax=Tuwongella immobilis TaxID=692036 RepID=A0A6C2YW68_9BACT|nr:CpaF family protein [Tuwongella immobilis]VIP05403.1 type ii secretion system protein e : Type II secretion system protein E OS=Pirellula staleyi (strain ATCC 27377 / DSM 6068 / ICPB 4128) GN=Psta_1434 PE=4 SV=1: T2SE [Tuwongella immobilis]VTS08162.1 type ii secretion system protein e : Type II secretion system protein E OS=Pirellula staleyi (strain ATCC 27377 / DSM 6068 / ICPB 4128) GN=Psta_1434 PE=4 SV=1: T2SE [Tuwongella immobilis]
MSRLQQGLTKLNSISHQGTTTSRLGGGSQSSMGSMANIGQKNEELKRQIHAKLVERLDFTRVKDVNNNEQLRREVRRVIEALCDTENPMLSRGDRELIIESILDEVLGFGPLEPLLKDPTVSDILVNGPKSVYVERRGKLEKTEIVFRDNDHLLQIIDRIVSKVGRRVDETSPLVDARLPDGSRVNAVIPPIALDGASLSIRRFGSNPLKLEDLLNYKAFSPEMAMLMEAAIKARLNIVISGGTGCGKTTLLNTLSSFIPNDERLVTIEDAAELQLQQDHVVRLETRPPNIEGKGAVTTRDLVKNALRMRPERIIIGECRGAETLDMLQAMNTGHSGSMTTLHANTPREGLSRLETMIMMGGFELPLKAMRQQIASAVDVVIQANRLQGGPRKVTSITEVMNMEQDIIIMQEIFRYKQLGIDQNGKAYGQFEATGVRPSFINRLEAKGIKLPSNMFSERILMRD